MSTDRSARSVEQMLARAHAFTQKVLEENGRLRQMVAKSHAQSVGGQAASQDANRIQLLESQLAEARARIVSLSSSSDQPESDRERAARTQEELADLTRRFLELEEQNNNLAHLYVASYQLHSTLDFKEVIAIVMEIVINMVGAETFCIMLIDGRTEELSVVTAEGMDTQPSARLKVGEGIIGKAAQSGEAYYRERGETHEIDFMHPMAAIPLKIKDHVIGIICVYGLFAQKDEFGSVDYELFDMLAGHAATAIFSAKLYSESERKLTTIQSFLDLLTTS